MKEFTPTISSCLTASVVVFAGLHVIFTMGTGYACGYYFLRALFPHDYTLVRTPVLPPYGFHTCLACLTRPCMFAFHGDRMTCVETFL